MPTNTQPTISGPIIDKIAITFEVDNSLIDGLVEWIQTHTDEGLVNAVRRPPRQDGYRYRFCIYPPISREHHMTLSLRSRRRGCKHGRIEFNPSKLSPNELRLLFEQLACWFGEDFPTSLRQGTVTRLDIALDIERILFDSFIASSISKVKRVAFTGRRAIETIYLGHRRNDQVCIYNKSLEQGDAIRALTRIEYRMTLRTRFTELRRVTNPFHDVRIVCVESLLRSTDRPATEAEMFARAAQLGGVQLALETVRGIRVRRRYQFALRQSGAGWWSADDVWGRWPLVARDLLRLTR